MATMTASTDTRRATQGPRAVGIWLLAVAGIITAMVTIGGLTRLTGSGLSITEWHPVTGVVPPLSDAAWQDEFAKYQHIPQYVRENRGMSLSDFKIIYWWEWTHRFLGRLLGVVFLLPFIFFAWKGTIQRRHWPQMVVIFALGGLQGFIGWWMVESGLETRVAVSQYRLAIHLGTAILLLGAVLWIALEYLRLPNATARQNVRRSKWAFAAAFTGIVYFQMLLGALVAGLHAGFIYNTWPSMNGHFAPEQPFFSAPWWINFFENPGLAQFDHRLVAYAVLATAIAIWFRCRKVALRPVRASGTAVLHASLLQVALGIATLLLQAPIALAAMHQFVAVGVFSTALWHTFERRYAAIA
jgi:heme a synthase